MGSTGSQVKEKHSWYCVTTDPSCRKVFYPFLRIHFYMAQLLHSILMVNQKMIAGNLYKEEGKSQIPSIQFAYNAPEDFGLWQIKGG